MCVYYLWTDTLLNVLNDPPSYLQKSCIIAQRPASVPVVDRSKKPVMTPSMHRRKLESLQPVFGSQVSGHMGVM